MKSLFVNGSLVLSETELILLDKDGTIIDIHHYWGSMIKLRAEYISQTYFSSEVIKSEVRNQLIDSMGIDLATNRMKPQGPVGIKPRAYIVSVATDVLKNKGVSIDIEEMENCFQVVDKATAKDITPLLQVLPHVEQFLEFSKHSGIKLGIVTTDKKERARTAMDALNLTRFFDLIIGGDQVTASKPSGEMAQKAMQLAGVAPKNVAVIGDHMVDIQMGINAGISCNIGVTTGLVSSDDLHVLTPYVIDSFKSLTIENNDK